MSARYSGMIMRSGAMTWAHGGFGTMIIEPVGSTYHDPKTGKEIRSGPDCRYPHIEPVGYGVNGSFRELMVQVHDTVPHTVNIVTAGNPPGQPIEVALEAGKTMSFHDAGEVYMSPMPFLNGGTHTTGSGLNFRAEPIASAVGQQSGSFADLQQRDPRRSVYAAVARVCRRYDGVPAAPYAHE